MGRTSGRRKVDRPRDFCEAKNAIISGVSKKVTGSIAIDLKPLIPYVIICFLPSYVLMALVRRQLTSCIRTCLVKSKEWRSTEFSWIGYRCIVAFLKAASWGHSCLMYLSTIWIFLFNSLPWGSMLMILPPMHPIQTFQHWNCLSIKILRISLPGLLQIICPSTALSCTCSSYWRLGYRNKWLPEYSWFSYRRYVVLWRPPINCFKEDLCQGWSSETT